MSAAGMGGKDDVPVGPMVAFLTHVRQAHGESEADRIAGGGAFDASACASCFSLAGDYRRAKDEVQILESMKKINIKAALDRAEEIGFLRGVDFPGSLRDWFAGQALVGLLPRIPFGDLDDYKEVTEQAFQIADAMVAERNKAEEARR